MGQGKPGGGSSPPPPHCIRVRSCPPPVSPALHRGALPPSAPAPAPALRQGALPPPALAHPRTLSGCASATRPHPRTALGCAPAPGGKSTKLAGSRELPLLEACGTLRSGDTATRPARACLRLPESTTCSPPGFRRVVGWAGGGGQNRIKSEQGAASLGGTRHAAQQRTAAGQAHACLPSDSPICSPSPVASGG